MSLESNMVTRCLMIVASSALAGIVALHYYKRRKMNKVPENWKSVGKVSNLHLYPLKSGRRIELKQAECTDFGLRMCSNEGQSYRLRDRSFIIYKASDKEFRTARTFPKIILIEVGIKDDAHVTLKAPQMDGIDVKIPTTNSSNETYITTWNAEKVNTLDCGDDVANWLSNYILDKPEGLRLGFHEGKERRDVKVTGDNFLKTYPKLSDADTGMFSDLSSFLLINQSSVDDLNERLVDNQVSSNNFRPNILVSGPKAYEEDDWDWIKIGDAVFRNFKPCTRCIMTTIDPETGTMLKKREPLKTLESYRLPSLEHIAVNGKSPVMGINMGLKKTGHIRVGDEVFIGFNS